MAHAVFACDYFLHEKFKTSYKEAENAAIALVEMKGDVPVESRNKLDEKTTSIGNTEVPNHVAVRNFEGSPDAKPRVMKVGNSYFHIGVPAHMWRACLPDEVLKDRPKGKRGYSGKARAAIAYLRSTMAHEIGHILLHPDEVLAWGQREEPLEKTAEANFFSDELIKLRDERRKILEGMIT